MAKAHGSHREGPNKEIINRRQNEEIGKYEAGRWGYQETSMVQAGRMASGNFISIHLISRDECVMGVAK